jgi:hypothetical protein
MNEGIPSIVIQLVWLAIPVITLFVSLKARRRQPDRGGNLMVAGSAVILLTAVGNSFMHLEMLSGRYEMDFYGNYYLASNVLGVVGQVLFLIGLYRFVEAARSSDGKKDVLNHFFD